MNPNPSLLEYFRQLNAALAQALAAYEKQTQAYTAMAAQLPASDDEESDDCSRSG